MAIKSVTKVFYFFFFFYKILRTTILFSSGPRGLNFTITSHGVFIDQNLPKQTCQMGPRCKCKVRRMQVRPAWEEHSRGGSHNPIASYLAHMRSLAHVERQRHMDRAKRRHPSKTLVTTFRPQHSSCRIIYNYKQTLFLRLNLERQVQPPSCCLLSSFFFTLFLSSPSFHHFLFSLRSSCYYKHRRL